MNLSRCPTLLLLLALLCMASAAVAAPSYRVAAPATHRNLTLFLIHGVDEIDQRGILTLQEAMQQGVLKVHETSNVNQLVLENTSPEREVFIQSGDIVKGGKQDRVLSVDIIVPARSGKMAIEAFCVESGRWRQRGDEDAGAFASSNDRIVSKALKLAAGKDRSQAEVWKKVAEAQDKLSTSLGTRVDASASQSSLQLSLEHAQLTASVDDYVAALSRLPAGQDDVIGYAFAINGRLNSADIYASNQLFRKLWPRLLKASATEAVAELNASTAEFPATAPEVAAFLDRSDKGAVEERDLTARVKLVTRESEDDIVFEAHDEQSKATLHRSYLRKK
jgi:hypothetical protein